MQQQANQNQIFQRISMPVVLDKGPKLYQTTTFVDQKELATEQSLDRVTVKHFQSSQNNEIGSHQSSQYNIYSGQDHIIQDQQMRCIFNSQEQSDYIKQSIPLGYKGNNLNLGQDCFVENIHSSLPQSLVQSVESSVVVPQINSINYNHVRQISPFNLSQQIQQPGQSLPSSKPTFQQNLNQVSINPTENKQFIIQSQIQQVQSIKNQQMIPIQQMQTQNLYQSFGVPVIKQNYQIPINSIQSGQQQIQYLDQNQFQKQQQQYQNQQNYGVVVGQQNQQQIPMQLQQQQQQYSQIQQIPNNQQQNNIVQINKQKNQYTNMNQIINVQQNQNNQINDIENSMQNMNVADEKTTETIIQNNNVKRLQTFNLSNTKDKQQQYTITFGSSNNLNTIQSGNNNSSTLYSLLYPFQVSNQSQHQINDGSKGSSIIDPYTNSQPLPQNQNVDFNCIFTSNNQLAQYPQLVTPPTIQYGEQSTNPAVVYHSQQTQSTQQTQQTPQFLPQNQQPYQFIPISMQRKGSQIMYISPKDSYSTALTSPIDIQYRQNQQKQQLQGESSSTTTRICEMSSNINQILIPSENISQVDDDFQQDYYVQNKNHSIISNSKHERYLSQPNSKLDQVQEGSQSIVEYKCVSQQQNGQNGSNQSLQSGQPAISSGIVQVKDDPIPLILSSQNKLLESQYNSNQSLGSNQNLYYYKTNAAGQNNNKRKDQNRRKINQSYDMAATYYSRIQQFNESSKQEKIELSLNHLKHHNQVSRRSSLNKTDKSLDVTHVHDGQQKQSSNSLNTSNNKQLLSQTLLQNQGNQKNDHSEETIEKVLKSQKQNQQDTSSNNNKNNECSTNKTKGESNEEKLLSLLSPSFKSMQKAKENQKNFYSNTNSINQKDIVDNNTILQEDQDQQNQIISLNKRPSYPKFLSRVNSIKELKSSSPEKQHANSLLNCTNNNNSSEIQYQDSNQLQMTNESPIKKQYPQQQMQQQNEFYQTEDNQYNIIQQNGEENNNLDQSQQKIDPYSVAEKYLNLNNPLNYSSVQLEKQNNLQIQQNQEEQQLSSTKHRINNIDVTITANNNKKNRYLSTQVQSQASDRINDYDINVQGSMKLNSSQTTTQFNQDNNIIYDSNQKNKNGLQYTNQSLTSSQVQKRFNPKQISTIFIDMLDIQSYNPNNSLLKGSQTTTNAGGISNEYFQSNKNNSDQNYQSYNFNNQGKIQSQNENNKNNIQDFSKQNHHQQDLIKEYNNNVPQQNILYKQQDQFKENNKPIMNSENNSQSFCKAENNKYQENYYTNCYSPDQKGTNENKILHFDTQFQTQEDQKSVQYGQQKYCSTIKGINMVTVESQQNNDNQNYQLIENDDISPDYSCYYLQESPQQILSKQIRPNNVPTLNLQRSAQNTLTTLNQNTSFNISQSPSQFSNVQQNIKNQMSYLISNNQSVLNNTTNNNIQNHSGFNVQNQNQQQQQKQQYDTFEQTLKQQNQQKLRSQKNKENESYGFKNQAKNDDIEDDNNMDELHESNIQEKLTKNQPLIPNFKRRASLSNLQNNPMSISAFIETEQQTNKKSNFNSFNEKNRSSNNHSQTPSLNNSYIKSQYTTNKKPSFNQTSNVSLNQSHSRIKRNKSLGNIVTYSEEMGAEMLLTKKSRQEIEQHLMLLENRINHLQREEQNIVKKANSVKNKEENNKKIQKLMQEQRQTHQSLIESEQKKYVEIKKDRISLFKRDHEQKINIISTKNSKEKHEQYLKIKNESNINQTKIDEIKQKNISKSSEQKKKVKQSQSKFQEQKHLHQMYNQTTQLQSFLLKMKDEKLKKEDIEEKIKELEKVEMQLVQKLQNTYETNKQYLRNSNLQQTQKSMRQSNLITEQPKKEILHTTTENQNTNTSFTVFNQN